MFDFNRNKDFWAGVMFIVIGGAAFAIARNYPMGSVLRMGAGYFPSLLGIILIFFGFYNIAKGIRKHEKIQGAWSIRALIVLPTAMVLFGLLVKSTGFIPALVVLIFGSAAAGREFRVAETFLFTAVLTLLCVAVFVWGLGLPYPLFNKIF